MSLPTLVGPPIESEMPLLRMRYIGDDVMPDVIFPTSTPRPHETQTMAERGNATTAEEERIAVFSRHAVRGRGHRRCRALWALDRGPSARREDRRSRLRAAHGRLALPHAEGHVPEIDMRRVQLVVARAWLVAGGLLRRLGHTQSG